MNDDRSIKSWKDWAVLTWKDIDSIKDDIKNVKTEIHEERKERERLEKDYIRLKAQLYILALIIMAIIGIIEISINILGK